MIQQSVILSELYGAGKSVVGFRQPIDPAYQILLSPNTISLSGVYLEDGLVSIKNIKECQDYDDITANEFNELIGNYIKDAIIDGLKLVFNVNDQLEYGLLYNYESSKSETLENNGDFVGFEIHTMKKSDVTTIINNLIAEFNSAGSVTLYLYHSSQKAALQSQAITLTENNAVEQSVNWVLDKHKDFGGTYYIGYYTTGLAPKAINRTLENSYLRKQNRFSTFTPFYVPGATGTELFNIDNIQYTEYSYGLNFNFSTYRDYTDYIVMNKDRFAKLIKYQFQANMLRMMASTSRTNLIELEVDRKAIRELEGILTEDGKVYSQGILRKLENEAGRLWKEFLKKELEPIFGTVF